LIIVSPVFDYPGVSAAERSAAWEN